MKDVDKSNSIISRNTIILLALVAICQFVYFLFLFKFVPSKAFNTVETTCVVVSGFFILLIGITNASHITTRKSETITITIAVLAIVFLVAEGIYAKRARGNHTVVLRVESVEVQEEYWSKSQEYTKLDGETLTLKPLKECYYIENNTPYRLRLYGVVYHRGKLMSTETYDYIEPYKMVGFKEAPYYLFTTPFSRFGTYNDKEGGTQDRNVNESYLCLDFSFE